ncbi:MAG: carboxysome peptide B [Pseudomonadota bacterium]
MDIVQVVGPLVCTRRHPGLHQYSLRLLRDAKGKYLVALDTCSSRPGNWVFVVSGSAARHGCGDPAVVTDLIIGGVIDFWDEQNGQA